MYRTSAFGFGPKHVLGLTGRSLKGQKALSGVYYFLNSFNNLDQVSITCDLENIFYTVTLYTGLPFCDCVRF